MALDALAAREGIALGPVVSLEEYPKNRLDTVKAVRDVDRGSSVIAVLSVHSTGSLVDRVVSALDQVATKDWSVHIAVDKSGQSGGDPFGLQEGTQTWARLGEAPDVPRDVCGNCRRGPARLVQIDPRTFDGMVLPAPELLVPAAYWAYRQRALWEAIDAADALMLEAESAVTGSSHPRYGADKFMALKVNFADLLVADYSHDVLAPAAAHRVKELVAEEKLFPAYDVVLVDTADSDLDRFDDFLSASLAALKVGGVHRFPMADDEENPDAIRSAIAKAESILILRLGVVSGLSLQHAMYEVQQLRRDTADYEMGALVLHLRPEDGRVRETLANSLASHLVPVFESYLPEDRHLLQEEHEVIAPVRVDDPDADAFLQQRLAICTGFTADAQVCGGPERTSAMTLGG
jgi:hypothetical protein